MPRLGLSNNSYETPRLNALKRLGRGPAHVKRLGHCVFNVSDFRQTEAWYKSHFGLITSDEIFPDDKPSVVFGAFLRCDRGPTPSDHHTLFLIGRGKPAFNHAAFEVADYDDLMKGNAWLEEKQRRHQWGVGRHVLGSQIFDYWRDPWGHTVEHWTRRLAERGVGIAPHLDERNDGRAVGTAAPADAWLKQYAKVRPAEKEGIR